MSEEGDVPFEVEQIESAPLGRAKVAIRISGKWRARRRMPDARAFLVVEADGRRHRFPAMPEPRRQRLARSASWSASFALPTWLEPRLGGRMSLWFANVEIPLPALTTAAPGPAQPEIGPPSEPAQAIAAEPTADFDPPVETALSGQAELNGQADSPAEAEPATVAAAVAGSDPEPNGPPRTDPEADAVSRRPEAAAAPAAAPDRDGTISALRAELRHRAATEAQLRGELAATKAELEIRATHQAELDETYAGLRAELDELLALVEQESTRRAEVESKAVILAAEGADLQERVADLTAARDEAAAARDEAAAARDEAAAARKEAAAEAERLRAELAELRSADQRHASELILLEARTGELLEQMAALRAELATSEVAREAAIGEAAGLREQLDRLGAELAHARGAGSGNGLSEAQALLLEARAVTARLRERAAVSHED